VVPESFNFSVLHSFILSGGGGPSSGLYHFHLFFLRNVVYSLSVFTLRCGYCDWRLCHCWFFEGRWLWV